MKVLMLNGSPHQNGCTYTALCEVASTLEQNGIESTILQIGANPVFSCCGCGGCNNTGRCVTNDLVNQVIATLDGYDALVIGSPVHYAAACGQITAFCDRLFFAGAAKLAYKPGAAVVSARRAGTTATFDQLNKYFTISNMPVVSSHYWNMVHGQKAEDARLDEEGMQVLRALGRNMAWLLKSIEAGKEKGITRPEAETRIRTNFIR